MTEPTEPRNWKRLVEDTGRQLLTDIYDDLEEKPKARSKDRIEFKSAGAPRCGKTTPRSLLKRTQATRKW